MGRCNWPIFASHNFGKWEDLTVEGSSHRPPLKIDPFFVKTIGFIQQAQRRRCADCGLVEFRKEELVVNP